MEESILPEKTRINQRKAENDNTMKTSFKLIAVSVGLLSVASASQAAVIDIFNTGVDSSGTPLADGTIGDPHYSLTSVPFGSTTDTRVRTSTGGYPSPYWLADNSTSAWIGPNNDPFLNSPGGYYTYETTFNLTSLNPSTALITGQWSTDNNGIRIVLNGKDTGNPGTSEIQLIEGYVPFTISSGFISGLNTLDFVVNNISGPTALRVELSGTATPVPEPSTILAGALLLLPFGVSTLRKLRRKS